MCEKKHLWPASSFIHEIPIQRDTPDLYRQRARPSVTPGCTHATMPSKKKWEWEVGGVGGRGVGVGWGGYWVGSVGAAGMVFPPRLSISANPYPHPYAAERAM